MNISDIKNKLVQAFPGTRLKIVRDTLLVENPTDLPQVAKFLKEDENCKFDYLSSVTGSDYLDYLEAVYHIYSVEKRTGPLVLRVRVNRQNPKIPSLCSIYRGAEFQEREIYDLFGIIFDEHPDLRRLLLWEGFEGFPLRKDYKQEDSETLDQTDIAWLEKHKPDSPSI